MLISVGQENDGSNATPFGHACSPEAAYVEDGHCVRSERDMHSNAVVLKLKPSNGHTNPDRRLSIVEEHEKVALAKNSREIQLN